MHQLKEVDMLSAKMDLLMKKLEDRANEKKEVMHIHDSRMTCKECRDTRHLENNCPEICEDMDFVNNNNYYRPQQDGISNRGRTTKVTIKITLKVIIIIILINHP
jgi:hypothetical protein